MNKTIEQYKNIIEKDYGLYVDIINGIDSNLCDILEDTGSTLLINVKKEKWIHMLLTCNPMEAIDILKNHDKEIYGILAREKEIIDYFKSKGFGFNPCIQYYYDGPKLPLKKGLVFRKPDKKDLDKIKETYSFSEEIPNAYEENRIFGLYKDNILIGYVGKHSEDACGMLHVFSEYRRLGYGSELEKFIINYQLDNGRIPYGHVIIGNNASEKLQSELNMKYSKSPLYWMWKEE